MFAGDRHLAAIGLVSGLLFQGVTDILGLLRERSRFQRERAAYSADLAADETTCDSAHLEYAIRNCFDRRRENEWDVFWGLVIVLLVAVVGAGRFPWPLVFAWLPAFALGVLTPTFTAASWLTATELAMRAGGVTTTFLRRMGERYPRTSRPGASWCAHGIDDEQVVAFTEDQKRELRHFDYLLRSPAGHSLRRWFRQRDCAFVSYVWKDAEKLKTAEHLDKVLGSIGIPSFRDTRSIQDPFGVWRADIASTLLRCTHFFLVVSPGIKYGRVVLREIETIVQRWQLEMLPAVICVVNPEDARQMRDDPQMPLYVRYLLTCCPQMTLAEAADPLRIRFILEHTRRQGKWSDWLTTLSWAAVWNRIQRMPGIVRRQD